MPRHQYGDYQKEIYLNGLNGKLPVYPVWAAPRFPDCRFRVHLRGEL